MGGAEGFAAKTLGFCTKKHYYHHGPFHVVCHRIKRSDFKNFTSTCWICALHGHESTVLYKACSCTLASENKFYHFTCTFTVALVQDYMRQSMMIIVLFDAKTQSFSCKNFSSTHMSGCYCMVLAKYLTNLLLLQCNFKSKLLLIIHEMTQQGAFR